MLACAKWGIPKNLTQQSSPNTNIERCIDERRQDRGRAEIDDKTKTIAQASSSRNLTKGIDT